MYNNSRNNKTSNIIKIQKNKKGRFIILSKKSSNDSTALNLVSRQCSMILEEFNGSISEDTQEKIVEAIKVVTE